MKNSLVKNITLKIDALRFFAKLNRMHGKDDTLLKLRKEVLHIKKHVVWIENILDEAEKTKAKD